MIISADEFMQYLKDNNLVIVDKKLLEKGKPSVDKLLSMRSVTFRELLDAEILPIKTKQSVHNWIKRGLIRSDAVFTSKQGVMKIADTEIKRLIKTYTNYEEV